MKKIVIGLFVLFLFLFPGKFSALSCVKPSPLDVAFNEYDGVMIGTVEKINENRNEKVLTIAVEKSFKGVEQSTILVDEDVTWGESRLNSEYLFFLNRKGGQWVHPLCSPTTTDTAIAEKVFAEKEEILLQEVDTEELNQSTSIFLTLLMTTTGTAAALLLLWLQKKK